MKTIGEQVKEFRLDKGWNTTAMAKAVGTSRQNIESLEIAGNRQPRYLKKLASVMGLSTDALINGGYVRSALTEQTPKFGGSQSDPESNKHQTQESIGSYAVNFNSNRSKTTPPRDVLTALSALLSTIDPGRMGSVVAMLGELARNPRDPALLDALVLLMTPQEFTQPLHRAG